MSGIARIQKRIDDSRKPAASNNAPGRELWFRDGDQVFLSSIATGSEEDKFLDEIYLYTLRIGNGFTNVLKDDRVDTSAIPDENRPSHKFAVWAYIHNVIHTEKRNDDWVEVEGPAGKKMYREDINDFRIISLSFGRSDYIWNQLVDVYSDWGALNKGVIRIKRTGQGMYDTSYSITGTPKTDKIPEDKMSEVDDLPLIKDYFFDRYGVFNVPEGGLDTEDKDDELF
jgi:hypothetical protein